ncbi:NB-ARC domain-containing protein [Bacillus cereus group sp. BfR-BA-01381]|uniref:NB-ARC domain-containing protein n=1 Tax=Bacillus cereus group sp. BfR-BA-01381 TaxID=2920325 RepID=UPI001F57FD56|nr:NB-ARC domain-containing protein [Bacillus cereus group sp. BfR-BA-01381]
MQHLNLSTRVLMFSVCTSLEYDLRKFLLSSGTEIRFTEQMLQKAKKRSKDSIRNSDTNKILMELDLGDYVEVIISDPYQFKINNQKSTELNNYFKKVIPIRNRVMHTRPLEIGDRATLVEVLNTLPDSLPWIDWQETKKTKETIEQNPHKLLAKEYDRVLDYESKVYHNLPEPEFDDTGYIGRTSEVKEIKELLKDKKNQIITIVGNGGIGKTAIAVKSLYDLLDDPENPFDSIIWISLKTRTLSQGEFTNIKGAIKDIKSLFQIGETLTVKEENIPSEKNIINFMSEFNTLLVLDNLETLNSEEILEFMRDIPENSKVLITSRHGLGELERRYKLDGLNQRDAITYFRELSQYYGLALHKRSDQEIKNLVSNHLYSSPLSIKWFISSVYNGVNENSIIINKDHLIKFCMSNVVEKLQKEEKEILQLFLIEGQRLSYGEIDYFLEFDEADLIKYINTLISTSLLFTLRGEYELNQMAKDYLSIDHRPTNTFLKKILTKRQRLNSILQDIRVKNENDPFSPQSLFKNLDNKNRKLASYYLLQSLEHSAKRNWQEAYDFINKASNISPDYFEVYKIKAFIAAENDEQFDAITNYRTALESCEEKFEEATILYLFSVFYTIKMQDFHQAEELINKAQEILPTEPLILLEKSRVLTYLGKYSEAEAILEQLKEVRESFPQKLENQFISRFADLYRRMAQNYQNRDITKKIELLRKAIDLIESLSKIDTKTYVVMTKVLTDLAFLHYNDEAIELLHIILKNHFSAIKSLKGNQLNKLRSHLNNHSHEINSELSDLLKKLTYNYAKDARNILEDNKGIVVHIKDHFGFIANNTNGSIYFNLNQVKFTGIEIGDLVTFTLHKFNERFSATNLHLEKKG